MKYFQQAFLQVQRGLLGAQRLCEPRQRSWGGSPAVCLCVLAPVCVYILQAAHTWCYHTWNGNHVFPDGQHVNSVWSYSRSQRGKSRFLWKKLYVICFPTRSVGFLIKVESNKCGMYNRRLSVSVLIEVSYENTEKRLQLFPFWCLTENGKCVFSLSCLKEKR